MAKSWDDSIKRLVRANPQQFLSWVLKDAQFKDLLSLELKNQTREADALLAATLYGQDILVHFEFQSEKDEIMEQRTLEYSVLAKREHNRPVYSFIIYLRPVKHMAKSPLIWTFPTGDEVLRFHFGVIHLWDIPSEEIRQTGFSGLLPLLPLTKGGNQLATAGTMIDDIVATKRPELLLGLAKAFASLVFTGEADKIWLERRFAVYKDILDESWAVQEWKAEGVIKGKAEGIIEGEIKGEIKGLHEALLDIFQARFPEIVSVARPEIDAIQDARLLRDVLVQTSLVQTPKEALLVLFNKNPD